MIFKLLKGNQLRISIQKVLVMNPLDYLLRLTSTVSAPFLDRTLKKLSSNRKINYLLNRLETKRLQKIDEVKKILIIPDINIGDAVIAQSFISPIKNSFPDIEIDYAYQHKAYPLIKENPHPSKYGVVFIDKYKLKGIIEKPKEEVGKFISIGIYKLPKSIW